MDRNNIFCYIGVATVLLTACVALIVRPRRVFLIRVIATGGMALALVWTWATYEMPYDFKRFWHVGHDVSAGIDYYALSPRGERQLILNPPTILPLFRAWALLPLRKSARLWVGLNTLGVMALVPLAYWAMRAQMGVDAPWLPRSTLAILAAAMALSCSQIMGLALGQVSVLMAAAILLALVCQAVGRPWLAGLCLAIATVKVNTVLPCLVLFLRKQDRAAWVSMAAACGLLCLLSGNPAELPKQVAKTVETIRVTYEPGQVNDYGYGGPSHASLVGIDHALYRVGLRDRRTIAVVQLATLTVLGAGLIRAVRSESLTRGAGCALVALYSAIFLYHRTYDMVLMIVPLMYAALHAEKVSAGSQKGPACVAVLMLLVPYVNPDGLKILERWSMASGRLGWVIQAIALPAATWLILISFAAIWWIGRAAVPRGRSERSDKSVRLSHGAAVVQA